MPHDDTSPTPEPARRDPMADYNAVADKVGLVPNIRPRDNLVQLAAAGIGTFLGAVIGFFAGGLYGVLLGGLAGFIAGGGLVGFYLMIVGLLRK